MGVGAGPWYIDDTLTFTVNTHTVTTGAATDADAVPAYRVYEDETGTAILTGNMAKLDDANTTGFYSEQITLSAANGFEVGKSYSIYVAATVNSVAATQSFNFKVIAAELTATGVWAAATRSLTVLDEDSTTLDLDATIRAAVGLATANLDTQLGDLPTNAETATEIDIADEVQTRTIAAVTSVLGLAANTVTASALAADAVTEIQSGLATSAALSTAQISIDALPLDSEISDAVWNEDLASHLTAGSTGEALSAAASVDTVVDAIKAKTDSLTFTVAGQVDANIKSVAGTTVTGVGSEADPWGP
jgi:hypothetical protein